MKKIRALQSRSQKIAAISGGMILSSSAFADDIGTSISSALETGNANVTTVVVGIVGLAALALGLGIILGLMRKS